MIQKLYTLVQVLSLQTEVLGEIMACMLGLRRLIHSLLLIVVLGMVLSMPLFIFTMSMGPREICEDKYATLTGIFKEKAEATGYLNVGAPIMPMQAREACNCWMTGDDYIVA